MPFEILKILDAEGLVRRGEQPCVRRAGGWTLRLVSFEFLGYCMLKPRFSESDTKHQGSSQVHETECKMSAVGYGRKFVLANPLMLAVIPSYFGLASL